MALTLTPWACDTSDPVHQAEIARRTTGAIVGDSGGVAEAGDLRVTQRPTPNMSVNVAPGFAFVAASATDGGVFAAHNDATINVPITASDPGNPRITLVLLVADNTTTHKASIVTLDGAPAAVPDAPAITYDNYMLLATVEVGASASMVTAGDITDERSRARLAIDVAPNAASLPTPGDAGAVAIAADTGVVHRWDGSDWAGGGVQGRRLRRMYTAMPAGNDDLNGSQTWPGVNTHSVQVPAWAKRAILTAKIGQAWAVSDTANHIVRAQLGSVVTDNQRIRWATTEAPSTGRRDITIGGALDVTSIAGSTVAASTYGSRVSGTGAMRVNQESTCFIDIEFFED